MPHTSVRGPLATVLPVAMASSETDGGRTYRHPQPFGGRAPRRPQHPPNTGLVEGSQPLVPVMRAGDMLFQADSCAAPVRESAMKGQCSHELPTNQADELLVHPQYVNLLWHQPLCEGVPRLVDVLPERLVEVALSQKGQSQRKEETKRRQRATGLTWSALYQRADFLCRAAFAESFLSSRTSATLQVCSFEAAILKALAPQSTTHTVYAVRDLLTPAFHEALAALGVRQGTWQKAESLALTHL